MVIMKKIIFLTTLFVTTKIMANNIFVSIDNNNSTSFKVEKSILRKSFNANEKALLTNNIKAITLIKESKKNIKFEIKKDLPSKKDLKRAQMNLGIIDFLDKLFSVKEYNEGDTLILVSSLDYKEPTTKTDSSNKKFNDAWITSTNSPLKRLIDAHPNMPLKGLNIIVLDPTKDIKYLHNRERFFAYFFSKLGAKLNYYGSLDRDRKRVIDYILTKKDISKIYQTKPLREENLLMLDDKTIQYELP
jgi:hypothetical protein